jgi:thymidylate synthase (FAD)
MKLLSYNCCCRRAQEQGVFVCAECAETEKDYHPMQTNNEIKVLNHGSVRLVEHMGSDLSIVRSARVSYDAEWRAGDDEGKDAKLIDYLVRNHHTSPLECVQFTFEVKAPIFVFRQWHRHRTWSFNEVSARYSELPEEFYIPEISQITTQSSSNKQMRTDTEHPHAVFAQDAITTACESAFWTYHDLLRMGVPRELARGVLPVNTFSHMFATVDLHNLAHFLRLRLHEHSQYEIRVYAQAMLELIEPIVPVAVAALKKHTLGTP